MFMCTIEHEILELPVYLFPPLLCCSGLPQPLASTVTISLVFQPDMKKEKNYQLYIPLLRMHNTVTRFALIWMMQILYRKKFGASYAGGVHKNLRKQKLFCFWMCFVHLRLHLLKCSFRIALRRCVVQKWKGIEVNTNSVNSFSLILIVEAKNGTVNFQ